MTKLLAIAFAAIALSACSNMYGNRAMGASSGNMSETKNSTDANKSGNPAAVSPGGGTGSGSGSK
ncbi:hypothetical protein HHL11_13615 [Ramlibacter sp. G-1-2-2]|uniref:Lipoprotein n=1 Tax=Ramlibacter agri TaxID=2728837 RepID=A0A848H672_9BURK|nr:hypothetical protein [Ramlibacter agri]NML44790.1 hypothetical protein [Ramlibacter agri]